LAEFLNRIEAVTRVARKTQELHHDFGWSSLHGRTSADCSSEDRAEKPVFNVFIRPA
jgi:hypothetical protein